MKNKNINHKAISRKIAMSQGAYDGRYNTKVVEDKKKKTSKSACRKKVEY